MKLAEKDNREIDICYEGDWRVAVNALFDTTINLSVIDIYAGGELDVEVFWENEKSSGIISQCF